MFIGPGFLVILLLVGVAAVIAIAIRHTTGSDLRSASGTSTLRAPASGTIPSPAMPSGTPRSMRTPRPSRPGRPAAGGETPPTRESARDLANDLDRWVRAGLLDPTQAAAIATHEGGRHGFGPPRTVAVTAPPRRRRIPVVAEALGYIGGILGAVGVTLLVQRSWADIGDAAHAAIAGVATVVLVGAGWLVHERRDPALARLRWMLWLTATATAGVFGWVLGAELIDVSSGELEAFTVAAVVGALAIGLWWNRTRPLQQVVALGAVLVAAGSLTGELVGGMATGVVVWSAGALMVAGGLALLTSIPALTTGVGAAGAMVGALVMAAEREGVGLPVACLTAATLLALAVSPRPVTRDDQRVVLTVFGIITLVQGAPQTIAWFARDAGIATGAVVWLLGLTAVATAVRRRVRGAIALEVIGGLVTLVGAAVTGAQSESVATLAGTATAIGFVGLGTRPGRVLMSVVGSVGLLAFVPWAIAHFFPGEGRAPLLILVSGAVLVGVAVLLTRQGSRFRTELTDTATRSEAGGVDVDAEEPTSERLVEPR